MVGKCSVCHEVKELDEVCTADFGDNLCTECLEALNYQYSNMPPSILFMFKNENDTEWTTIYGEKE